MKIAIAQLNYTIGDFEGNKEKIIRCIRQAKGDGAKVVMFSEQAISGRPAYDLLNDIVFLERCNETLSEIAKESTEITTIIGLPLQIDNDIISAAAIIHNGKISRYVGKQNVISRDERYHLSRSHGYEFLRVEGRNIAVVLGSDIYSEHDFGSDVDVIVSLKSTRYSCGIIERRYDFYSKIAYKTHSNVIAVNQLGGQTDIVYDGSSFVFNRRGEAIVLMRSFEEDYTVFEVDGDYPPIKIPVQDKARNVYRAIKLGLKDYFAKNGFKKACLGLSGGIDSAVVCALASEVLGPENIHVLMMPSQYSSDHSVGDAVKLAETLGIKYDIVPITGIFDSTTKALAEVFKGTESDVTEENIQARTRGMLIMALSNKFGYITLNTSNKSECAVGYETMYGDTVGAFSILGDLYKTEVYELARYINRKGEIIPQNTIIKEPSAELCPDHKDSDSLPLYDELDAILYRLIEENQTIDEITTAGFDIGTVLKVFKMLISNEYKRYQFCPVLRLSTCTLGKDRILPLTYDSSCLL
ncbi:MAG: NAD+ synthase [Rikenellaceae bacterium]|nr:NAD+ synthase [Rikenellaceae bacterium]